MKIFQNSDFIAILNYLKNFTSRAYFVGGFVRDLLLNRQISDIDIEVYDISPKKFDEIMSEFGAIGTGKQFFVYKFKNFDISLPRTENKVGIGHKAFEVAVTNNEKIGAKRRDFTINSMMINIFTGEILDFYGGVNDLKNRILRVVDSKTFIEDSLRVYRGVQFAARFDLQIENKSFEIMRKMDTSDLSIERIIAELMKLFNADFQGYGLILLRKFGLFKQIFGCEISENECIKIADFIDNGRKFVKDEAFFLYSILNLLNLDKKTVLENLKLHGIFKKLINEAFYENVSDEILLQIALKMPLCQWLGLYDEVRIERAKELKIYDKKFISQVKSKAVIEDGFRGKEIAMEIQRRQNLEIKDYIKNVKIN